MKSGHCLALAILALLIAACSKIPEAFFKNNLETQVEITIESPHPDYTPTTETADPGEKVQLLAPWSGTYTITVSGPDHAFTETFDEHTLTDNCGGSSMRTCNFKIENTGLSFLPRTTPLVDFVSRIGSLLCCVGILFIIAYFATKNRQTSPKIHSPY